MFANVWAWIKILAGKAWAWIRETDWWAVFDSDEFVLLFPMAVFAIIFMLHYTNPLSWALLVLWGIVLYRRLL